MCRWHVATAVAFPQKRNPTFSAKIKPSVRAAFSFNEQDALCRALPVTSCRLFLSACNLPGWNMQSKYDTIENGTPGEEKDNVEG